MLKVGRYQHQKIQSSHLKWSFHKYPQTNSPDWPQYIPWRISWENLIKAQSFSLKWSFSKIFTYYPSDWPVYEFDNDQSIFLGDHFVNSHNLFSWLNIDVVRRKLMWVTLGTWRVNRLFPHSCQQTHCFQLEDEVAVICSKLFHQTRQPRFMVCGSVEPGAHNAVCTTAILGLCNGIFTDQFIFSTIWQHFFLRKWKHCPVWVRTHRTIMTKKWKYKMFSKP